MNRAALLRQELAKSSMIVAPGAYDCLTATLIAQNGFSAVYMTGGGTATAFLGVPDYGLLTMNEMADNAGRIANAVKVPVIADADTGYGNELNVIRTVREYERRLVAGIQIEDQVFPKKCGHFDNKQVVPAGEFIAKIKAAVMARENKDTVIVARTDVLAISGFKEAVDRMNDALAAGADVAFLEAPQTIEQMAEVPRAVKGPCLLNLAPKGGKTPRVSMDEAQAMGYKITILPGLLSRHVAVSCEEVLKDLQTERRYPSSAKEPASMVDYAKRFGAETWDRWRTEFR